MRRGMVAKHGPLRQNLAEIPGKKLMPVVVVAVIERAVRCTQRHEFGGGVCVAARTQHVREVSLLQ